VPVTVFHATKGFVAADNSNNLPAMGRIDTDRTNGFGKLVGGPIRVHNMAADHFTIIHDQSIRRIAGLVPPALGGPAAAEPGDVIDVE
jgi:polyketide synthase PksM